MGNLSLSSRHYREQVQHSLVCLPGSPRIRGIYSLLVSFFQKIPDYSDLKEIGHLNAEDIVVVSSAFGTVGRVVCQMAKLIGI